MLARHQIGRRAIADRDLLESVVRIKELFFSAAYTRFGDCLKGRFRLVPDPEGLKAIEADYEAMKTAGMLHEANPSFDEIARELRRLEKQVNDLPPI
jgi:hypothetical protein